MFILGILNIGETVKEAFIGILLAIDGIVFGFIDKLYQAFIILADARILSDDVVQSIIGKISIVFGVLMLFILSYSILMTIINPDGNEKSRMGVGNIIKNIVISIILLALVPALFNFAYKFQNVVLKENVIGKLILGNKLSEDQYVSFEDIEIVNDDGEKELIQLPTYSTSLNEAIYSEAGKSMAITLFNPFFRVNKDFSADEIKVLKSTYFNSGEISSLVNFTCSNSLIKDFSLIIGSSAVNTVCITNEEIIKELDNRGVIDAYMSLSDAFNYTAASGDFGIFGAFSSYVINGEISYTFILSTICGLITLYLLCTFCIDLAIRAAKLAYFQLIAPIPILFRLIPKGVSVFNQWLKKVGETFVEVFIRILVIYFAVFIISTLPDAFTIWLNNLTEGSAAVSIRLFVNVVVIIGLLIFAKQAPKFFCESLGISSGNIHLGIRDKLADASVFKAGTALGAGVQSAVRNFNNQTGFRRFTSALGGFGGAAVKGFKGSNDVKTLSAMRNAKNDAVMKSEEKRIARKTKRNYLNSMTDEDGNKVGYLKSRLINNKENIKMWAGIGPTTAEYEMYDELLNREQEIKKFTEKLFTKYDRKSFLTDMDGLFSGDNKELLQQQYDKYIKEYKMSYKEAEAQLNSMKRTDTSSMTEEEKIALNREVNALETMLIQLKRKSLIKMENELQNIDTTNFNSNEDLVGTLAEGMRLGELKELQSKLNIFVDEFNKSGIKEDDNGNKIVFQQDKAGDSSNRIAIALDAKKARIARELERRKLREQALRNNKNTK